MSLKRPRRGRGRGNTVSQSLERDVSFAWLESSEAANSLDLALY